MKLTALLLFLGCGTEPQTPAVIPDVMMPPVEDPKMDPPPPPPWMPPAVLGSEPAIDVSADPNVVEVELVAAPVMATLFEGMELEIYAYNGQSPGPTIHAKVGDEVVVHFTNNLDEPTTIHWHGLRIPDAMDGSPRIQEPVQPGESFTYRFIVPEAGSFWYHPHVRANEQIEKGLYGTFVVHEVTDPVFDRERYIVLDDILVTDTGLYPFLTSHPEIMHGRNGNVLLTNGRGELPVASAAVGEVERWRIVNTANARTMELTLSTGDVKLVSTDGGRLAEPETVRRLIVSVGQRYELEVHHRQAGRVELLSHVLTQSSAGEIVKEPFPVFAVDVAGEVAPREIVWASPPVWEQRAVDAEVDLVFDAQQGGHHGLEWTLNGKAHSEEPMFTFTEGQTVKMRLVNNAGPEHPFHLHGQFFEEVNAWPGGVKDTVLLSGLETIEIIAHFDNPGRWMAHCHILEHQELGMMGEIVVLPR